MSSRAAFLAPDATSGFERRISEILMDVNSPRRSSPTARPPSEPFDLQGIDRKRSPSTTSSRSRPESSPSMSIASSSR